MHITDFNVMPGRFAYTRREESWSHERPAPSPHVAPLGPARLNVLDTDRDGWVDEDDIPYDQLLLLQREHAKMPPKADATVAASYARAAAAPLPGAPAKEPVPVEATPRRADAVVAQIDLLA